MRLEPLFSVDLGQKLGQCRSLSLRCGGVDAILLAYAADYDVDPYNEMFFYPSDTLKLALIDLKGQVLWERELGRGVVPGVWFTPFFAFDLDGDGDDELYFVNNIDDTHPLSVKGRRLERIDPRSGETNGQWPWPHAGKRHGDSNSHAFREFLLGGHVKGQPVLVTAQGTYGRMTLQGWNAGMQPRWEGEIAADAPGARGSHMCPVVDINHDDADEFMWGERCIAMDDGRELFCCDRDSWRGHSDMAQPVLDRASGRWNIYSFRESFGGQSPRVAVFDDTGRRVWADVEQGHMDMGWVATLDEHGPIGTAIRIGHKTSGPGGHGHPGQTQFAYRVHSGEKVELFDTYKTIPVDLNGDGRHELVRGLYHGDGAVLDAGGNVIGQSGGFTSRVGKIAADHPGEQVLTYTADGRVQLIADREAVDTEAALSRYRHRYYRANQRLGITGYNIHVLGGV